MMDMITYANTDVIVVGARSAGRSYAYELSKNPAVCVVIIEQSVSPWGGAWLGGQLFSAMVVCKPAHRFLNELGIELVLEMKAFNMNTAENAIVRLTKDDHDRNGSCWDWWSPKNGK